jgi:hypothetical protein
MHVADVRIEDVNHGDSYGWYNVRQMTWAKASINADSFGK